MLVHLLIGEVQARLESVEELALALILLVVHDIPEGKGGEVRAEELLIGVALQSVDN